MPPSAPWAGARRSKKSLKRRGSQAGLTSGTSHFKTTPNKRQKLSGEDPRRSAYFGAARDQAEVNSPDDIESEAEAADARLRDARSRSSLPQGPRMQQSQQDMSLAEQGASEDEEGSDDEAEALEVLEYEQQEVDLADFPEDDDMVVASAEGGDVSLIDPDRRLLQRYGQLASHTPSQADDLTARLEAIAGCSQPVEDVSYELWNATCTLFGHPKDATDKPFRLSWLQRTELSQAQACSLVRMLLRGESMRGGFLCNSMGLGKTCVALALVRMNAMLEVMRKHVTQSRDHDAAATADGASGHLTRDGRHLRTGCPSGTKCPSGQSPDWPFQCVCEEDGVSARLEVVQGCVLIVAPAGSLRAWAREIRRVNKAVGVPGTLNFFRSLRVFVGHGEGKRNGFDQFSARAHTIQTLLRSNTTVLTTAESFRTQVRAVINRTKLRDGGPPITFGLYIFDEAHKHIHKTSYLFQTILRTRSDPHFEATAREKPVMWFLTGTPFPQGPSSMANIVLLFEALWRESPHTDPDVLAARQTVDSKALVRLHRAVKSLRRQCDDGSEAPSDGPSEQYRAALSELMKPFAAMLACLMIKKSAKTLSLDSRLDGDGRVLPVPLVRMPALHAHTYPVKTSGDDAELERLDDFVEELDAHLDDLKADRAKGAGSRRAYISRFVVGMAQRFALAFPFATHLFANDRLQPAMLTNKSIEKTRAYNLTRPSPFRRHAFDLMASSQKMLLVVQMIALAQSEDELNEPEREHIRQYYANHDPTSTSPLEDHETQHLILASAPGQAVCIAQCLLKAFPHLSGKDHNAQQVKTTGPARIALVTSSVMGRDRAAICRGFQKELWRDCNDSLSRSADGALQYVEASRPLILVSTVAIMGTSTNLPNASWTYIFDPPMTLATCRQASSRGHRWGSPFEKHAFLLLNEYNKRETDAIDRYAYDVALEEAQAAWKVEDY